MTSRSPFHPWSLLAAAALVAVPASTAAQATARVRADENFRQIPNGEVLARLEAGTPVSVVGRDGRWREVVVEGWVWTRSLQTTDRDGLDLVVSTSGGENLRAEPSGGILGRLGEGTLLKELERRPGWIRARRQGWIWAASLTEETASASTASVGAAATGGPEEEGGTDTPASPADAPRPTGLLRVGGGGAAILSAPDGDTLARAVPGGDLEVTGRRGSWARVRVEGWTWLPEAAGDEASPSGGGEAGAPLTPAELAADPLGYRGRVVTWSLQFISLEEAERVRTDFFEGEPFLLTRYGGSDGPFVYVAVPPGRRPEVEGLTPLEGLAVTGRVRTGSSALTGTPILDLMTLERDGASRF